MTHTKSLGIASVAVFLVFYSKAQAVGIDFDGMSPGSPVTSIEGVTFSSNTGLDLIVSGVFDGAWPRDQPGDTRCGPGGRG